MSILEQEIIRFGAKDYKTSPHVILLVFQDARMLQDGAHRPKVLVLSGNDQSRFSILECP